MMTGSFSLPSSSEDQVNETPEAHVLRSVMGVDGGVREPVLLGASTATVRLRSQVERIGPHFRVALIQGETGVRKGKVAWALHEASPAAHGAFVVCDCLSLQRLQDECAQTVGGRREVLERYVSAARGGTMFFPDVDEYPRGAQDMLLQVLEYLETPRGERVRVIASAQRELQVLVTTGEFAEDLRARLEGVVIRVAPLRERTEDIPEIVRVLLERTAAEHEVEPLQIEDEALRQLEERVWRGNVRELESVLRMAALASEGGVIEARHLPSPARTSAEQEARESGPPAKLQQVIEAHVLAVLRECEGNKLKAAEALGISRSTLYRMLEAAGVGAAKS